MTEEPKITFKKREGDKKVKFYDLCIEILKFHPEEEMGFSLKDIVDIDVTNAYLESMLNELRQQSPAH